MKQFQKNMLDLYGMTEQIQKSQEDFFEKGGKRAQIGEIRTHKSGMKFVKHADGWVQVNEKTGKGTLFPNGSNKPQAAEEHHLAHYKEHIGKDEVKADKPKNSQEIGKTKSGKSVYEDGSEHEQDEDWTAEDHKEAAVMHSKIVNDMSQAGHSLRNSQGFYDKYANHSDYSDKHLEKHSQKAKEKSTSDSDEKKNLNI